MPLKTILDTIHTELSPYHAQLVAVSKTYPASTLRAAYDLGVRDFGENRV